VALVSIEVNLAGRAAREGNDEGIIARRDYYDTAVR
jgi:hypothetical protein